MYKYCIDEIILTVTEFEARWKIHDFEMSPDLGLHGTRGVAFNNDENRYASFYSWEENETGDFI